MADEGERDTAKPDHDLQRTEEPARNVRYRDAIHRLDEATEKAARHIKIEPDPHDYDDAEVERPQGRPVPDV